jgi:hypothetical protein
MQEIKKVGREDASLPQDLHWLESISSWEESPACAEVLGPVSKFLLEGVYHRLLCLYRKTLTTHKAGEVQEKNICWFSLLPKSTGSTWWC